MEEPLCRELWDGFDKEDDMVRLEGELSRPEHEYGREPQRSGGEDNRATEMRRGRSTTRFGG